MYNVYLFVIIYFIVGFAWRGLEVIIYGEPTPRMVDDIIGIVLALSIYENMNNSEEIKKWIKER